MTSRKYFEQLNKTFDANSNEDMRLVYKKDGKYAYYSITKQSNNNSAYVFDLNEIIQLLLNINIKEYYLCHNHPHETTFLSLKDYNLIKNII